MYHIIPIVSHYTCLLLGLCYWIIGEIYPCTAWYPVISHMVEPTPLKNDGVRTSWDDEIPN